MSNDLLPSENTSKKDFVDINKETQIWCSYICNEIFYAKSDPELKTIFKKSS